MILYYCMGGGLGHLTRLRAVCNTLDISPIVMSASSYARDTRVLPERFEVQTPKKQTVSDNKTFIEWVRKTITDLKPETLFIDSFPGGILGELCDLPILSSTQNIYISRILKVKKYKNRLSSTLPPIAITYQTETLSDTNLTWIKDFSKSVETINLRYPTTVAEHSLNINENTWVIAHSGNNHEIQLLYRQALELAKIQKLTPDFLLISPSKRPEFLPSSITHINHYPVHNLLIQAGKIFSASGFNTIKQITNISKHIIIPMERALDDQFLRLVFFKGSQCTSLQKPVPKH